MRTEYRALSRARFPALEADPLVGGRLRCQKPAIAPLWTCRVEVNVLSELPFIMEGFGSLRFSLPWNRVRDLNPSESPTDESRDDIEC
jgi:hypothetical protein